MSTTHEARTLRDLVDDLCTQLERSGANETGLPPVYAAREISDKRKLADDLIYSLLQAGTALSEEADAEIERLKDRIGDLEGAIQDAQTALSGVEFATPAAATTPVPA